mmetsp:Transcript_1474/g.3205  ORF Transcript_1474/g.3205 Transcript_1474/m.3205 type:complete len:235 (-) Transcript_1474:642-1346(-)
MCASWKTFWLTMRSMTRRASFSSAGTTSSAPTSHGIASCSLRGKSDAASSLSVPSPSLMAFFRCCSGVSDTPASLGGFCDPDETLTRSKPCCCCCCCRLALVKDALGTVRDIPLSLEILCADSVALSGPCGPPFSCLCSLVPSLGPSAGCALTSTRVPGLLMDLLMRSEASLWYAICSSSCFGTGSWAKALKISKGEAVTPTAVACGGAAMTSLTFCGRLRVWQWWSLNLSASS